ncbi:GNAT family N-acetyltransferase [Paraburkholderia silviterrae]|uniref:GNAT family N-acetyltransferase n=1 Tax=Paraburkholderia silviterrae TaxID=2528715 RepID=UPI001F0FC209|nr:GNAT family N-acetyltransferase [Paraburkholderia silviterrae]
MQQKEAGVHELMNIAVRPEQQQLGVGSRLLLWVIELYRDAGARALEVGTGSFGYQLTFYQRHGFRVVAIDRDFFVMHYQEPIFEEGIRLRDMLRLRIEYGN